ncbi:MAG TPA: aldehyde ferredoxin oxidoreductase family protein [Candidatus Wallbacteria bacterium]|nr:aldehyde ferredoxin oxidoreductase family protein [Candidatus Wallbacteria bacterium]
MAFGHNGKLLEIDLGMQSYREVLIDPRIAKTHFLGSGYAAYYFLKYFNICHDALAAEAPLLVITGMVTGTPFPTACKMSVCGKSPLTGIWNESTVGGFFPSELKATGYDGIILLGRARNPIYLIIQNGNNIDFKDASHLWGKDVFATDEIIRAEHGANARVFGIGPAGENRVKIAAIISEGRNARSAGRGGMGAVFGSKNLKAIVAIGNSTQHIHNPDALTSDLREIMPGIKEKSKSLHEFGTAGGMKISEAHGSLPVKNWREGSFESEIDAVSGQQITRLTFDKHYSCYSCPIGCGKLMNIIHPEYGNLRSHSPEYEGAAGFSSLIGNGDPYLVCAACEYCDRMGLDPISASSAIAFAMECFENSILTGEDLPGVKTGWGSAEMVMRLLEQMAKNEGLGKTLAMGVREASKIIGKNSSEYAIHVKGLELAMHDPRAFYSMAANYVTANRGACHLEALSYALGCGYYFEGIGLPETVVNDSESAAEIAITMQNFMSIMNPLGICKFLPLAGVSINDIARWASFITGENFSSAGMLKAGERIFNEKRLINCRLGISRKDDMLPPRLFTKKRGSGKASENLPNIGLILSEYYRIRGWSESGVPTSKKLNELEIEFKL